jgi:hypothetical protein
MKCKQCGNRNVVHQLCVFFANVVIAIEGYCSTQCALNDFDAFAFNMKKNLQCANRDMRAHVSGDCPCGIIGGDKPREKE